MSQLLPQDFIDETIAVLVLYKSKLCESESYLSLTKSIVSINAKMDIVVYDNSPTSMVTQSDCISDNWRIHYIHDKTNPGVSKAYNEGFKITKKLNKKWVLLLDQDTTFPRDAIPRYFQAVCKYKENFLFVPTLKSGNKIWSPCRYFLKRGFPLKVVNIGINPIKNASLLNSGMLLHISLFQKTGPFNEKIKLYFSDFYFVEQYRKHFTDFVVIDLVCTHGISTITENRKHVEESLTRFRYFCEGAKYFANNSWEFLILTLVVAARTVKLSLIHKNLNFFAIFYDYFFARNSNSKKQ